MPLGSSFEKDYLLPLDAISTRKRRQPDDSIVPQKRVKRLSKVASDSSGESDSDTPAEAEDSSSEQSVISSSQKSTNTLPDNNSEISSQKSEKNSSDESGSTSEEDDRTTRKKSIGHDVIVDRDQYELIDFYHPLKAVAELCLLYFGRNIMATHSVTGGQAPGKKIGEKKSKLPPKQLSAILNHVLTKFQKLRGAGAKIEDKNGERVPLTLRMLRQAVMKKCYSCSAH
jgi:BEN domain